MTFVLNISEPAVARDKGPSAQREAARIWAAATAHRDGKPEPAPVESALPIIEGGLRPDGSTLHVAYLEDRVVGFAVVVPRADCLEILYLGVDPDAWGAGVARRLLLDVVDYATETARADVELWVYDDNVRAVTVYRRAGWLATDDVRLHERSGRRERRYVRPVPEADGERHGD